MMIRHRDHLIIMSDEGGSILLWQWGENIILGPTRLVRTGDVLRIRGESHWCFPYHGSAPAGSPFEDSPKHGYLRDTAMIPGRYHSQHAIHTAATAMNEIWASLLLTEVMLQTDGQPHDTLLHALECTFLRSLFPQFTNLPILPAAHPYFNTEGGATVSIGGNEIGLDCAQLGPLRIARRDPIIIDRPFGRITMKVTGSHDCDWIVVWSDNPGAYVCVEPIWAGEPGSFATLNQKTFLEPDHTVRCRVEYEFEPK